MPLASELTIHKASGDDIALIRSLSQQIWPATYANILTPEQIDYMMDFIYSEESLKRQMESNHEFIIVYQGELPIGFASYSEKKPGIYKLHKIYLMKVEQGRGHGKFVIQQIIKEIKEKGATVLQLNVNRYNTARVFYEKLGFEIIGPEDVDIGNGYFMEDYVMEKKM